MLELLQAFTVHPIPQPPMQLGSNLTIRCRYYEPFLINGASFAASSCLICAAMYAFGSRLASLGLRGLTVQLAVFLTLSVPFQVCILDYPFGDYRTFVVPYLTIGCVTALFALAHKTWIQKRGCRPRSQKVFSACSTVDADYLVGDKRHFNTILSAYRSALYICTSLCIFCRDLPCWNNRFSKSKTFGTGLMDLGIGCFVICLGSVGPTAVRPCRLVDRSRALRRCVRQSALLAGLGLCFSLHRSYVFNRFVENRARAQITEPELLDTPFPPAHLRFLAEWWEYGVHWTAFHSLALARALGTGLELLTLRKEPPPLLVALMFALLHEIFLSAGLAKAVLAPGIYEPHNRSNLIGQNREGLASIPGLFTLYFAGLQLGRWVRDWSRSRHGLVMKNPAFQMVGLLVAALLVRSVAVVKFQWILPESRRLLNFAYCAWVVAISSACLLTAGLLYQLRRCLAQHDSTIEELLQLRYLSDFDKAGFASFLLSNLLTGLFNMALDAANVNREHALGSGQLCFATALVYSVSVQLAALQLVAPAKSHDCWQQKLKTLLNCVT